jgi:hypothetical protein
MGAIPILLAAAIQGWLLYGLHYSIDHRTWPATSPGWLLASYAIALFVPTALQLLVVPLRERAVWLLAGAIAVVAGALGGYGGWSLASLKDQAFGFAFLFALYGALFAAWFIALPFVQARLRRGNWRVTYADLFEFSWQNALVLAEALLFTGVFWLLLFLWQALFKVIAISFFADLFNKPAFVYPISSIAFGYAIYLIESNEKIVATLRRHLLGVFSWLLPLVAVIAVLFLFALPFTGLQPLWKTGHATALMLWLQVLFLHFVNSAYQDGQAEPRYPAWLKLAVRAAVLTLPVYAALCAYSLGLRVEQHGWTVSRVWAAIGTFLAASYGVAYAAAALRGSPWMGFVSRINVAMAALVAVALLLAVSPVLDPKRLATASQVARLNSGSVPAARFDYDYLRFDLGRYGCEALADLAKGSNGEVARLAAASLAKENRYAPPKIAITADLVVSRIELYPSGTALDPAFVEYLQEALKTRPTEHPVCLQTATSQPCLMLAVDLDGDRQPEIVTFRPYPQTVYSKVAGQWQKVGNLYAGGHYERSLETLIREGKVETEHHAWQDLVIGAARFSVQPAR